MSEDAEEFGIPRGFPVFGITIAFKQSIPILNVVLHVVLKHM